MHEVEKKWYALRIVASIQAFLAWLIALGCAGFGLYSGISLIKFTQNSSVFFLGYVYIVGGIIGAILIWALSMASAQMIRLFISIEEHIRSFTERNNS
jgi:hypothetical protein